MGVKRLIRVLARIRVVSSETEVDLVSPNPTFQGQNGVVNENVFFFHLFDEQPQESLLIDKLLRLGWMTTHGDRDEPLMSLANCRVLSIHSIILSLPLQVLSCLTIRLTNSAGTLTWLANVGHNIRQCWQQVGLIVLPSRPAQQGQWVWACSTATFANAGTAVERL